MLRIQDTKELPLPWLKTTRLKLAFLRIQRSDRFPIWFGISQVMEAPRFNNGSHKIFSVQVGWSVRREEEFGERKAWNYIYTCYLQFLPKSKSKHMVNFHWFNCVTHLAKVAHSCGCQMAQFYWFWLPCFACLSSGLWFSALPGLRDPDFQA